MNFNGTSIPAAKSDFLLAEALVPYFWWGRRAHANLAASRNALSYLDAETTMG